MIRIGRPDDAAALQAACFARTPVETVRDWLDPAEETDRVLLVATDDADVVIGNCTLTRRLHRLERHRAEIGGFVEWARMPGGFHDHDAVYDDVRLYRLLSG